jgi:glycosyltransferase involved in cell wall biosynthesis
LIDSIEKQIIDKPVEFLVLTDNAKRPVGTKRNDLLKLSNGKYVCFIDDDDRISETYVDDILREIINWSPDVIVFDAEISFNGVNSKLVKYGREYDYCEKSDAYYRHPNHLMVHKKENITEYFKDIKTGEDDEWALRMLPRIVTQSRINKILYYYDYNTSTKKYFD